MRKRIAFVWYWDRASEILPNWRDGLRAAIEEIEKKHDVVWFLDKNVPQPEDEFDFILFWDDSNSPFFEELHKFNCKKGICLTTDPSNIENLRKVDVVYCESPIIYNEVRKYGLHAILAFGTDSNFYTPDKTEKTIEVFYPATFSPWKKQSELTYLGDKLTCVGTIQPDGQSEYEACVNAQVNLKIGYFPAEEIRDLYNKAKKVIIPAIHGSERTVLEAMSMNVPVESGRFTNAKVRYLINQYLAEQVNNKELTPREFILKNYSAEKYAYALLKGMI